MTQLQNQRIVLAARPDGRPQPSDFRVEYSAIPEPAEGEVLLENLYLSLDPYMRWRMSAAKSYAEPVGIGEVMVGGTVARIKHSRNPLWQEGDIVLAYAGWQRFALSDGLDLRLLDPGIAHPSTALGVLECRGSPRTRGCSLLANPSPVTPW